MSLVIEDTRTDIDSPISGKGVRVVREGGRSIPEVNGHTLFLQPFESNPNVESVEVVLKGVESRRRRNILLQSIYGREQLWLETSAKLWERPTVVPREPVTWAIAVPATCPLSGETSDGEEVRYTLAVKVKHSGWFGKSTKTMMPVFVVRE